jgi:hypothetical protein
MTVMRESCIALLLGLPGGLIDRRATYEVAWGNTRGYQDNDGSDTNLSEDRLAVLVGRCEKYPRVSNLRLVTMLQSDLLTLRLWNKDS